MFRLTETRVALAAAMLAGALITSSAMAQQPSPPAAKSAPAPKTTSTSTSTEPSAWDKTKDMTRKEWDATKAKWAMEKDKWKSCNAKSKEQALRGTKRWTFIGHCMTD